MDKPITIEQAAHDASIGANDSLWQACWEIACEQGYRTGPKTNNQAMCERVIRSMSK